MKKLKLVFIGVAIAILAFTTAAGAVIHHLHGRRQPLSAALTSLL